MTSTETKSRNPSTSEHPSWVKFGAGLVGTIAVSIVAVPKITELSADNAFKARYVETQADGELGCLASTPFDPEYGATTSLSVMDRGEKPDVWLYSVTPEAGDTLEFTFPTLPVFDTLSPTEATAEQLEQFGC